MQRQGGRDPEPVLEQKMDSEATKNARIAALQEEISFIHYANELYWRQTNHTHAAKAEYFRRQDRLEEVRSELAKLQEPD
jgi:hypothetical protein